MHTFRPSRGRVFFEVFCALAIAASFAGGWIQTGAWALLPAAVVAALYSLVHAFDLAGRSPAFLTADSAPELNTDDDSHLATDQGAGMPVSASDQQLDSAVERVELVEPNAPPVRKARKTKAPRKSRARKATEDVKVTEPVPPQEEIVTLAGPEDEGFNMAEFSQDVAHIPLAPLFEPKPFVRQQRAVFGRKAG